MLGEAIGATLMIRGLVGAESSSAMGQAALVIGAIAIIAMINYRRRAKRT